MNVNQMMEDYFKAHDEEVIENAKLKIIEDATYDIAKRLLEIGVSVENIQISTHLSDEQMKILR